MVPIIIVWNEEAERLVQKLRYGENLAFFARKAQQFIVQIPPQALAKLELSGSVENIQNQYRVLINNDLYRDDLGLCPEDPSFHEIESFIV
jgi:CRISPR-associated endonuclease/helicase Cas3